MKTIYLKVEVPDDYDETVHFPRIDAFDVDTGDLAFDTLNFTEITLPDEGVCKWKKVGNLAGICNKKDGNNPRVIFVDLLQKAEEKIGEFKYCPFCGKKIERV